MTRREFATLVAAAVAGGKPLAVLVSQRAGKKTLFREIAAQVDFLKTTKLEAACLPTMFWPTVTLSRAEVEKRWPSRGRS